MDSLPKIDIITLIEKDSKTRLSRDYQNALVNKIKSTFSAQEQQLFVASFYCYLNYNTKTDFVIDFTDVWKWCGFTRKEEGKRLLTRHFTKDIDYKVESDAPPIGGASLNPEHTQKYPPTGCAGYNKEKITLTVNAFKKFCMKAGTKKSDEIHDYYVKLEELLQETLKEQTDELQKQLEEKSQALSKEQSLVISLKKSHAKLVEKNHFYYNFHEMPCVYILSNPDISVKKFKIGYTDNMNVRLKTDRTMAPNLRVEFLMYTPHAVLFEKLIKTKYRRKLEALNHEWVVEYLENLIKFYRDINALMEFDGIEEINVWQYNLDHDPAENVSTSEEKKSEEAPKPRETVKSRQCKSCRRKMDRDRWNSFDIEGAARKIFEMVDQVELTPLKDFINLHAKDRLTQIIRKLNIGRASGDKKSNMVENIATFFIDFRKSGRNLDVFFTEKE